MWKILVLTHCHFFHFSSSYVIRKEHFKNVSSFHAFHHFKRKYPSLHQNRMRSSCRPALLMKLGLFAVFYCHTTYHSLGFLFAI